MVHCPTRAMTGGGFTRDGFQLCRQMFRQPGHLRQLLLLNCMTKRSQIIARLVETSL
ncbi:hypothetical protein ECZU27_10310 [Escherichia coli]|nr:hypothetical protein ECZU27_10310 [Escherichia coli]